MEKYLRLGYVMDDRIHTITEEDAKMLTHVNLAFGLIKDGLLDMGWLAHIDYMDQVRKWNPDIKVVISIGGWGAGGFSIMSMHKETRAAFIESVRQAVEKYNLDGVDIDWEYPCEDAAKIDADPRDKQNFTYLMQELREMLGDKKSLSMAAGAGMHFIWHTEMDKVGAVCDYVQIMTYDMRGFGGLTGHHTGLYHSKGDPNQDNTASCTQMMIDAGVPAEKIVIGSAFYPRGFAGVKSVEGGAVQPFSAPAERIYSGGGFAGLESEAFMQQHGFRKYWDEEAHAPYLYNGDVLLTYDDVRSVEDKCAFLKQRNLLGIMYWAHGDGCQPLLRAMYRCLHED